MDGFARYSGRELRLEGQPRPPRNPDSRRGRLAITWLCGNLLLAASGGDSVPTPADPPAIAPNPSRSVPPALPPPPPAVSHNPVETLRQLLAKDSTERDRALAARPEGQRRYLQERLREFDALSPADRELRLRLLQLRYYLLPLMKTAPTNRDDQLRLMPPEDRKLVQERLEEWDRLPAEFQKDLLQNESTLRYFPRFETGAPAQPETALPPLPPDRGVRMEEDLARWRGYTPEQRARMYRHFQQFFDLSDRQRERTLQTLPEAERRQMERAILTFEKLPPDQRDKCIAALQRFVSMSPEERNRLLANAARWESMSPEERRAWRELVSQLPPLPPGLPGAQTLPPFPPTPPSTLPTPALTNAKTK